MEAETMLKAGRKYYPGSTCPRGWDRETKKFWPTLVKEYPDEAWGLSLQIGKDLGQHSAHWSGIVAAMHASGVFLKVSLSYNLPKE